MKMNLDELEVRVLGCLMEKELTTPEYYPLSLNALTSACNQKSNRVPAMLLTEEEVVQTLDRLSLKGLARLTAAGGRVARYCHSVTDKLKLKPPARAVLAELMLRGAQTEGELRIRIERMISLPDPGSVAAVLDELMSFAPPLVTRLPRQPGRKEQRNAHLFSGSPVCRDVVPEPLRSKGYQGMVTQSERLSKLDVDVTVLRTEISDIRDIMARLKTLFD